MARTLQNAFAIFAVTLLAAFGNEAHANVLCDVDMVAPQIQGEIMSGDFVRLLHCLRTFVGVEGQARRPDREGFSPLAWVTFDSEGGDVGEAIRIGTFLRESLAEIAVNKKCFSACFLAVVGAVEIRGVGQSERGKIGIHRFFHSAETLKQTDIKQYEANYNQIRQAARKYLSDLDVPTPIEVAPFV